MLRLKLHLETPSLRFLGVDAFVPYFGDNGNTTTLNHSMWMAGIVENITVADAMNVENEGMCIEYA